MTDQENLTELRTIQDWVIKPQLRSVPGVAEVNSWGGLEKQYQVDVDPARLIKYSLTLSATHRGTQEKQSQRGRRISGARRRESACCKAWASSPARTR